MEDKLEIDVDKLTDKQFRMLCDLFDLLEIEYKRTY